MTPRNYSKTRRSHRGFFLVAGLISCASIVLVVCLGLNVSSAGAGNTNASTFGLSETSEPSNSLIVDAQNVSDISVDEGIVLTKSANRNIDKAVNGMLAKEEAARIAAEEALIAAEALKKAELETLVARSEGDAAVVGLEPVDWTLGHDAFVSHWTARIDSYLAGSPLAGQGLAFAEAAWSNGIDPRLSPAISNTESSKGSVCFLSHNAWGWGQSSWDSWEQAIAAHVSGLAKGGYGPMITYSGAQRYCPPNYDNWYRGTTSEMAKM